MAPPVLIAHLPAEPTPNAYVLPGTLNFIPTAVTALFDGSGAAGSYIACLTFKSQDGLIMARTFPETEIAAGGSAEVTYAPF